MASKNQSTGTDYLKILDDWFHSDQNQLGMDLTSAIEDGNLWHFGEDTASGQKQADILSRHLDKNHMLFRHRFHLSKMQDVTIRNGIDEKPFTPVRTYRHYIRWCEWYFGTKDQNFIKYRKHLLKTSSPNYFAP